MVVDPRELERLAAKRPGAPGTADVVTSDRACPKCGYSLKGLPTGGVCPECGRPITSTRRNRHTDNLADAPLWYLAVLKWSSLALVALGALAVMVIAWVRSAGSPRALVIAGGVALAVATGIVAATSAITMRRGRSESTLADAVLDSEWRPWVIRALMTAWIGAAAIAAIEGRVLMTPGAVTPTWVDPLTALACTLGAIGLAMLTWWIAAVADWASDDSVGERLRMASWAIGIGAIGFAARGVLGNSSGQWLASLAIGIGAIAAVVLLFTLMEIAQLAAWAVRNHTEAEQRALRIAERERREEAARPVPSIAPPPPPRVGKAFQQMAEEQLPKPAPPSPAKQSPAKRPAAGYNMQRREVQIEPPLGEAGADPYGVVEDEPGPKGS